MNCKFLYILFCNKYLLPDRFVDISNIITYLQNLIVIFRCITEGALLMRKETNCSMLSFLVLIKVFRSDFVGCESFFESNSPDIFT